MRTFVYLVLLFLFLNKANGQTIYFPPLTGNNWESISPEQLGWNTLELQRTDSFVEAAQSKAFLILKDGKLVWEKYYGSFTKDSMWYWASAGKSLSSFVMGLAVQSGFVHPDSSSSFYLGKGFTSLPDSAEQKIKVRHQLSMSTGLNDKVPDPDCTLPACLIYAAEPGTRWAYHNAPYSLLEPVIEKGVGKNINVFMQQGLKSKTGMDGFYFTAPGNYNPVYYSTPRAMARFGLLMLNKGKWENTPVLTDTNWYQKLVNSSQELNPAYGYLWWLNGKSSYMVPGLQVNIPGFLCPDAPADMYAAMGKNGQFLFVVPSQNLVIVRMGNNPEDQALVPFLLANQIWTYLKKALPTSSVSEVLESKVNLYPNPFTDWIELETSEPVSWGLYSLQGEYVASGNGNQIQTKEIKPGTWFVRLTKGNQTTVKKVVKLAN
ncbi:MAG: serine hydrolase [Bacteroidetes bacterium]|nr:serine hydrolase [Bacteroidota bacterium]